MEVGASLGAARRLLDSSRPRLPCGSTPSSRSCQAAETFGILAVWRPADLSFVASIATTPVAAADAADAPRFVLYSAAPLFSARGFICVRRRCRGKPPFKSVRAREKVKSEAPNRD